MSPPSATLKPQSLALGKLFPALTDADATDGPFIVNTLAGNDSFAGYIRQGEAGNSVFLKHADARATIPWAPIFVRENDTCCSCRRL